LVIALPLSLLSAWGAGFLLFSGRDSWLLAVLAVIVVPVDLAPAVAMVRDKRVPARLREILNVESALNDGLVAPVSCSPSGRRRRRGRAGAVRDLSSVHVA
jgi:sodium/hydrogen antiporter